MSASTTPPLGVSVPSARTHDRDGTPPISNPTYEDDTVPDVAHGFYRYAIVDANGGLVREGWERSLGKAALLWNLTGLVAGTGHGVRIIGFQPLGTIPTTSGTTRVSLI